MHRMTWILIATFGGLRDLGRGAEARFQWGLETRSPTQSLQCEGPGSEERDPHD